MILRICFIQIEKNLIQQLILMKANIRTICFYSFFFLIRSILFVFFSDYLSCRNVPIRQMSTIELAEIEKKVKELEQGIRTEDIDEDDAGKTRELFRFNY